MPIIPALRSQKVENQPPSPHLCKLEDNPHVGQVFYRTETSVCNAPFLDASPKNLQSGMVTESPRNFTLTPTGLLNLSFVPISNTNVSVMNLAGYSCQLDQSTTQAFKVPIPMPCAWLRPGFYKCVHEFPVNSGYSLCMKQLRQTNLPSEEDSQVLCALYPMGLQLQLEESGKMINRESISKEDQKSRNLYFDFLRLFILVFALVVSQHLQSLSCQKTRSENCII